MVSNNHNDAMPRSTTPAETVINLCSASAGARVLFASDEWFAAADRLLQDTPPLFDPRAYCPQGKVMDGWESRRRREPGHDWCLIQLSQRAATLQRVELDTAYFTGNQAPAISIQATDFANDIAAEAELVSALPRAMRRLLLQGRPGYDMDVYRGTGATPAEVAAAEAARARPVPL
jgi:allantoicase